MPNGKRQLAYSCWSLTIRRVPGEVCDRGGRTFVAAQSQLLLAEQQIAYGDRLLPLGNRPSDRQLLKAKRHSLRTHNARSCRSKPERWGWENYHCR
jgi:hypothetical protein